MGGRRACSFAVMGGCVFLYLLIRIIANKYLWIAVCTITFRKTTNCCRNKLLKSRTQSHTDARGQHGRAKANGRTGQACRTPDTIQNHAAPTDSNPFQASATVHTHPFLTYVVLPMFRTKNTIWATYFHVAQYPQPRSRWTGQLQRPQ